MAAGKLLAFPENIRGIKILLAARWVLWVMVVFFLLNLVPYAMHGLSDEFCNVSCGQ